MKLTWKDHEEIAWALIDKFPDQDPLKFSFPKLHALVCGLEEFGDKPDGSNEKILENIQMAWLEDLQIKDTFAKSVLTPLSLSRARVFCRS